MRRIHAACCSKNIFYKLKREMIIKVVSIFCVF